MTEDQIDYASYLLRLWKSDQAGAPTWRASLESTHDGQRVNFANLEALIAFLNDRFGQANHATKNASEKTR